MRSAHYAAFEALVKAQVPALASLTFDGDVPLNPDGTVRKATYYVLHDMGFDHQDDDRLTAGPADAADGTYRVVVRCVGESRMAVRAAADAVTAGVIGKRLVIAGRVCGPIAKDPGPAGIDRDDALRWADLDFIWRSTRA